MYRYEDVREVHLEITTRRNASCPQCPRNLSGGDVNPALPIAELSLDDMKCILPRDFVARLRKLYACGNYGDPMVAKASASFWNLSAGIGAHRPWKWKFSWIW